MKKVPPEPLRDGNLEKTFAGVRVWTILSNQRRTEMTSMDFRFMARAKVGRDEREGEERTTEERPVLPRAKTTPLGDGIEWRVESGVV